ncbi:MAG: site-2 protease family protein [Ktedonobacterales bacterium]|nr:site-2 protease family protein [Ktedonobacterales bacterium]
MDVPPVGPEASRAPRGEAGDEQPRTPGERAAVEPSRWPAGPPPPPPEHALPLGWGAQPPPETRPNAWQTGTYADYPPTDVSRPLAAAPRAGRPEARGCAFGTLLIAVLSKLALVAKVFAPLLTAAASLVAYALIGGWWFGLGLVALLFVHEMGHFVVIRAKGLPASLPIFIPLLGAYVAMRRMPANARDEAEIAIAGPLAGALGGVVSLAVYQQTEVRLFLALAYFSFILNLLNLIPVSPLDGGRIVGAISRWFLLLGLLFAAVAFFYTHNILLLILIWLGGTQTWDRFSSRQREEYYTIPFLSRAYVTMAYFGLAAGLALGMVATQRLMILGGGPLGL